MSTPKTSKPVAVRWDRLLEKELNKAQHQHKRSSPLAGAMQTPSRGAKNWFKRNMIKFLKGPALRVRNFVNAPITERVDQSRMAFEYSLDTRVQQIEAEMKSQAAEFETQITQLRAQVASHERQTALLHEKADEQTRKNWSVMHLSGAYAVPLADGYIFIPEADESILLMYTRATSAGLEPGTRRVIQTILKPGDHAIDVGASVGLHSVAMANAVGHAGLVDAFEAEPRLESVLQRTFKVNGMHHVHLHAKAIGAKNGKAQFYVAKTIGHSSLYDLGGDSFVRETVTVPLAKLDSALQKDVDVRLIKIDVEGAELDVLKGANKIIESATDCAIIAECGPSHLKRTNIELTDWINAFEEKGYKSYAITEPFGTISALDVSWLETQESVNVLFLKKATSESRRIVKELGQ